MRSSRLQVFKSFWLIWLVSIGLIALFLSWSFLSKQLQSDLRHNENNEISFIGFLDRYVLAFKHDLEDKWVPSRYLPSQKIQILSLRYPSRADFWFDLETRKKLSGLLASYPGLVLLNIDTEQSLQDPTMKTIFENANLVRNYRLRIDKFDFKIDREIWLAANVEQSSNPKFGSPLAILPTDSSFYSENFLYGLSMLSFDQSTHLIYDFPLLVPGALKLLPSNVLTAWMFQNQASKIQLIDENEFQLKTQILPNRLPLRFYDKDFITKNEVEKINKDSKDLLIVEIGDDFSDFQNFRGRWISWGSLAATALSNLHQNHLVVPSTLGTWLLGVLFALAVLWILVASSIRLQNVLVAALGSLLIFLAVDFVLSIGFGYRTQPIEEVLSLFLLGIVGISTRAIIDVRERQLVERALSGYVSEERLKRLISGKEALNLKGRHMHLTTLLFDVAGFSKITKNLPTEKTFELIQKVYSITDPLVFAHGGVIDKKTGDGFLAFFGDDEANDEKAQATSEPLTLRSTAYRACLCALRIQEALATASFQNFFGLKSELKARIGVNTGEMMIGNAGSELHFNYTVMGDAVNFTQRLEAACPAGKVLVGPETSRLVSDKFEMELKEIPVKDLTQLQPAYLILSSPAQSLNSVQGQIA